MYLYAFRFIFIQFVYSLSLAFSSFEMPFMELFSVIICLHATASFCVLSQSIVVFVFGVRVMRPLLLFRFSSGLLS